MRIDPLLLPQGAEEELQFLAPPHWVSHERKLWAASYRRGRGLGTTEKLTMTVLLSVVSRNFLARRKLWSKTAIPFEDMILQVCLLFINSWTGPSRSGTNWITR